MRNVASLSVVVAVGRLKMSVAMATETDSLAILLTRPLIRRICGWNHPLPGHADDWEALTNDPEARLAEGAIIIPNLGFRIFVVYFPVLVGTWPITAIYYQEGGTKSYVAIAVGAIALLFYVFGCAYLTRRELRLESHGFRIFHGINETFVPWNCMLIGRDWIDQGVNWKIPVTSSFREMISTTDGMTTRTIAEGGKLHGLRLTNSTQISLFWTYRIDPWLFHDIAVRMSAIAAKQFIDRPPNLQKPSNLDVDGIPLPDGVILLKKQSLQIASNALVFPPVCCSCGIKTNEIRKIAVQSRLYWSVPDLTRRTLTIPTCEQCANRSQWRFVATMFAINFIFTVASTALLFQTFLVHPIFYLMNSLPAALFTSIVYRVMPPIWSVADVIFNPSTDEYRIRFSLPHYRELLVEYVRNRDNTT